MPFRATCPGWPSPPLQAPFPPTPDGASGAGDTCPLWPPTPGPRPKLDTQGTGSERRNLIGPRNKIKKKKDTQQQTQSCLQTLRPAPLGGSLPASGGGGTAGLRAGPLPEPVTASGQVLPPECLKMDSKCLEIQSKWTVLGIWRRTGAPFPSHRGSVRGGGGDSLQLFCLPK